MSKNPCMPGDGCPQRSATCHTTCQRYLEWRAVREAEIKMSDAIRNIDGYVAQSCNRRKAKKQRKSRNKRWQK